MLTSVVRPVIRSCAGARNVRGYHAPTHFKEATMNDLPVPQGSWQEYHNSKQRKYNMQLLSGIAFFLFSCVTAKASGMFELNLTPPLKNKD